MDFLGCLKDSDSHNIYNNMEMAWAEYEYVCSMIKTHILELINNDFIVLKEEYGIKDEGYAEVEIKNATIVITVKPGILISTIKKIEDYLGIDGRVMISSAKKNAKMKIIFYNADTSDLFDMG